MRKIQIKNIGPLEDSGVIYIKPVMLIIGKQSMGKSTQTFPFGDISFFA